jgi:hypothetical protein
MTPSPRMGWTGLAVQREEVLHQEEQHERHCQRHRDPHVVFHRRRTLVHLSRARTPLTGVEFSTKSLRFVTRPPWAVISPGSRGVAADPAWLSRRDTHRRIFIQSGEPSAGVPATHRHSATFRHHPRRPRSGSTVAKALIRRSKAERKRNEAHRGSRHDRRHRIRHRWTRRRCLPEPDPLKRTPCTRTNSSPDTPPS